MKIALVYDRVNKWGGAERVLLALHEIWPDAPLYASVYDADHAPWARVFDVRTSFLQHIPLAKNYHELLPILTPMAFEAFSFDEYDLVLSVTSAEAKSIITKPQTLHICYCLTPTRYLWSGYRDYINNPGLGKFGELGRFALKWSAPTLRRWDSFAANRPDYYIAISEHVAKRINKFYGKSVEKIIYPPVGINPKSEIRNPKQNEYFLTVTRLVGYKRIDILIEAFNELGWQLVIVGDGRDREVLQAMAGPTIRFVTRHLTDEELSAYYGNCRAFVFAADEDFGIVAAEAQACGKPVIAYRRSGVAEIVIDGQTGILFDKQTKEGVLSALRAFEKKSFDPSVLRKNAVRFNKEGFEREMKKTVEKLYSNYKKQ